MLFSLLSFITALSSATLDPPIKVVVLDTGLDIKDERFVPYLCPNGHLDFTGKGIEDVHNHGTHVFDTITRHASGNYCLIVVKYAHTNEDEVQITINNYLQAFQYATTLGASIINISGGGQNYLEAEKLMILRNKSIKFIVAAGNDGANLDLSAYYPGSYGLPNITVVGSRDANGRKSLFSNYGSVVTHWENGERVLAKVPCKNGLCELEDSGTSMATAIKTGKLIHELSKSGSN